MKFARNLVTIRTRRRMTQAELAAAVGMQQPRICEYESGAVTDPHVSVVIRLARALRVRVDKLLG